MRDIRDDLKERITVEERRREPVARMLAGIDANISTLKAALAMEEARAKSATAAAAATAIPVTVSALAREEAAKQYMPASTAIAAEAAFTAAAFATGTTLTSLAAAAAVTAKESVSDFALFRPSLAVSPTAPLIGFLMEKLMDGPQSLETLRDAAEAKGYFRTLPNASPGRMVHGAMLNAMRASEVARDDDQKYRLTDAGKTRVTLARKELVHAS
jgi:hypothetical protein